MFGKIVRYFMRPIAKKADKPISAPTSKKKTSRPRHRPRHRKDYNKKVKVNWRIQEKTASDFKKYCETINQTPTKVLDALLDNFLFSRRRVLRKELEKAILES